jgi:hypothetical protein
MEGETMGMDRRGRADTGEPVFVCGETGCIADEGQLQHLRDRLEPAGSVRVVGCQHLCGGPLVGVRLHGRLRWLGPLTTEQQLRAVVDVLRHRGAVPLPRPLDPLQRAKPHHTPG